MININDVDDNDDGDDDDLTHSGNVTLFKS